MFVATFQVMGTLMVSAQVEADSEDEAWETFHTATKELRLRTEKITDFSIESIDMDEISEDV